MDLKLLCSSTGTFRFMRFTGGCCSLAFPILLTSPLLEVSISGYEYLGLFGPSSLAEVDQHGHLVEADLEGGGHRAQLRRISRDVAGFDRRPLGELYAGETG